MNLRVIFSVAFLCITTLSASGQNKVRQFIGISADNIVLKGSFNGNSFFTTENEIILVPKLDPGFGAGFQYGFNLGGGIFDIGYHLSRVNFTTVDPSISGTGTIHLFRYLGLKMFLWPKSGKKFKPYLDIDLAGSVAHFEKITYKGGITTNLTSANFGGIILGSGLGGQLALGNSLVLDLRILPEVYIGTDIIAKKSDRAEINKFTNFLLVNSIGINYYFSSKK